MNDKNKKRKDTSQAQKKAEEVIGEFVTGSSLKRDPLGSYTGKPDIIDKPEQDADDL